MGGPLTARDLGIAQWEHDALVALVPRLRDGSAMIDMRRSATDLGEGVCLGAHLANAQVAGTQLANLAHLKPAAYVTFHHAPALRPLLFPRTNHPGWRATASQGADAIEAFLAGAGARCWDIACAAEASA